jgi:hypothetical protein
VGRRWKRGGMGGVLGGLGLGLRGWNLKGNTTRQQTEHTNEFRVKIRNHL